MAVAGGDVVLARGVVDADGARHRRARLRPLTGRAELELDVGAPHARASSTLLAAGVERLGGYVAVSADHVAALTRGDRWRLALTLRRLLVGDRLPLTVTCPDPDCRALADLDLDVGDLVGEAPAGPDDVVVDTPDGPLRVRPPTGADDEACEAVGGGRGDRAAALWDRLVTRPGGDDRHGGRRDGDVRWAALGEAAREAVSLALADLGDVPDLDVVSPCPECGAWIEVELDPFALLARDLGLAAARLLAEVHCLAFHYGWSEDAILDLPRSRRWRYLELLRDQLEGRPLLDHRG